jgi:hypothetical protein
MIIKSRMPPIDLTPTSNCPLEIQRSRHHAQNNDRRPGLPQAWAALEGPGLKQNKEIERDIK